MIVGSAGRNRLNGLGSNGADVLLEFLDFDLRQTLGFVDFQIGGGFGVGQF